MPPGSATVGNLVVSMSADLNQLNVGVTTGAATVQAGAKSMAGSLGTVADATDKTNIAGQRYLAQLKQTMTTMNMTEHELMQHKAALLGVGEEASELIAKIKGMSSETDHFSFATAAAKRELLVLGHEMSQGNFKNFAGSMLVLGERTGAASMLFSAAGLAALSLTAGVAFLAAEWYKASSAVDGFSKAQILTNGASGLTLDGLQALAHGMDDFATGGIHAATQALTQLSATGHYSGSAIEATGAVVLKLAALSGQSSEDIIKDFDGMSDGVAKWAAESNKHYNFINGVQYEHIRQLELHGDKDRALIETMRLLDASLDTSAQHVSLLSGTWKVLVAWAGEADEAIKKMLSGPTLGESARAEFKKLADLKAELSTAVSRGDGDTGYAENLKAQIKAQGKILHDAVAANNADILAADKKQDDARANQQSVADRQQIDKLKEQLLTQQQKREEAAAKINGMADRENARAKAQGLAEVVTAQERQALIAAANEKFKDEHVKGADDRIKILEGELLAEKSGLDREKAIYESRDKMLDLFHAKFGLSDASFYSGRATARDDYINAEQAAFEKEAAAIKSFHGRNPEEIAASNNRYQELLRQHLDFNDKMQAARLEDEANALAVQKEVEAASDDAINKYLTGLNEEARKLEDSNRGREQSKGAVERETIARYDLAISLQHQLMAEQALSGATDAELEQASKVLQYLNDLRDASKRTAEALDQHDFDVANDKAAKKASEAWDATSKRIESTLADAIANGGGNAWKKLRAQIVSQVLSVPLQFVGSIGASILNPTAAQAVGGPGGGAGVLGIASAAKSAYDAIASGFTNMSTTVADGVQSMLYQTGLSKNLLTNGPTAEFAGQAAGYTGGLAAGKFLGSAISGQYSIGDHGSAVVNIASIAGAIFAGPIGAAIGGAIGGLFNRAFGMGSKQVTSTSLVGSFDASGFAGNTQQQWHQDGGWFRSDKNGTDTTALDAGSIKQLSSAYDAIKTASTDFATVLGVDASSIATRSQALNIALTKDDAANQKAISDFFLGVGNDIATELVPSLATFSKEGEVASATLQRIAGDYAFIDTALNAIGMTFGAVGVDSVAARERLVDLSGGIDTFGSKSAFFAQNFLTDQERLAPVIKSVGDTMTGLGLASVVTRDQFKAAVLGLISSGALATEAGAKEYAALMNVEEAFAQVHPAIEATGAAARTAADILSEKNSLQDQLDQLTMTSTQLLEKQRDALDATNRALFDEVHAAQAAQDAIAKAQAAAAQSEQDMQSAITTARSNLTSAYQRESSALQAVISGKLAEAEATRKQMDALKLGALSSLSPEAKYAESKRQFEAATGPDKVAAASAFLDASRAYNASTAAYTHDYDQVQKELAASANAADATAAFAAQQLGALDQSVKGLIDINSNVISVRDAIVALGNAEHGGGGAGAGGSGASGGWNGEGIMYSNGTIWDSYTGFHVKGSYTDAQGANAQQASALGLTNPWTVDGTHAGGLNYVPFDGYVAKTHRAEAILTAPQAQQWRSGGGNAGTSSKAVESLLTAVLAELRADKVQRSAVGKATLNRLDVVADKLDGTRRELARA